MQIPKYDDLFQPVFDSIKGFGGRATNDQIEQEIIKHLGFETDITSHPDIILKLKNRLTWARSYLKKFGLLDNPSQGTWTITSKGESIIKINAQQVKRFVKKSRKSSSESVFSFTVLPARVPTPSKARNQAYLLSDEWTDIVKDELVPFVSTATSNPNL